MDIIKGVIVSIAIVGTLLICGNLIMGDYEPAPTLQQEWEEYSQ